ncbi:hypothetical protein KVV02_000258 [Mortierella alpina]|uniref:Multiple inositol polyphosphate phosphatase 1 n=1 Tax=Mortierella alpina TaxID=64518 RepID=A0A9P8IG25_MORAP|nr:hypothetical protein KVV02_000258 [Mortierella alpina]
MRLYWLPQSHMNTSGSRYPGSKDSASYQKLVDKLSDTDVDGFDWIEDWKSKALYPPTMDKLLAPRGDEDLYSIGNRFAIRYKAFLDKYPYTADMYEFRSSAKSRSSQSAIAFAQGLFRDRVLSSPKKTKRALLKPIAQPVGIFTIPSGLDQEMEIETSCKKWMDEVDDNPAVGKQREVFEERFLPALANTMSKVFGVKLSTKEVDTIHQMCAFEVALYDDVSTWCQVLFRGSSPDGKVRLGDALGAAPASDSVLRFEIADDLEDFYANGPGIPFNRIMACKLGTSLMESIELALSDNADESKLFRAHLKFGHSETIMFFSTFLGLYNRDGKPLTGNMTDEQLSGRDFRGSVFSPFSANIAFEVYKPKKNGDEGLVRLLINEKPFSIPGCDGKSLFCKWSTLKSILIKAGAGCNIDACCAATAKSNVFETLAGTETCPSTSPVA